MQVKIQGTCEPGFEPVLEAFRQCFQARAEVGAATCVYVDGQPVVDLWAGVAHPATGAPWQQDTLVHVYSVTKAFAALGLLTLVDQGEVDLDRPVAHYWPEFAQAGKGGIPVRWLLTHQAGLLGIRAPLPPEAIFDWDRMVACLAAEPPWWSPGERHGEHAYFFGHLVGEVVRRVSGRSAGEQLKASICAPWQLDFGVGLSAAEQARCATVVGMDDAWRASLGRGPETLQGQASGNPYGLLDPQVINSAAWRSAEIPAVNGHGTAHAIARFYGGLACGGTLDGTRILSERLVHDLARTHASGPDVYLERHAEWGLGVQIDVDGFGMGGLGGALGWGNLEKRLGFAYVTNHMGDYERSGSVYIAAAKVLGIELPPDMA